MEGNVLSKSKKTSLGHVALVGIVAVSSICIMDSLWTTKSDGMFGISLNQPLPKSIAAPPSGKDDEDFLHKIVPPDPNEMLDEYSVSLVPGSGKVFGISASTEKHPMSRFEALAKALTEKYGAPSEDSKDDNGRHGISWKRVGSYSEYKKSFRKISITFSPWFFPLPGRPEHTVQNVEVDVMDWTILSNSMGFDVENGKNHAADAAFKKALRDAGNSGQGL